MNIIEVVNKKQFKGEGVYVGRPSVLGNPYSHLEVSVAKFKCATREEAIEMYKGWLRCEYKNGGNVKAELDRLVGLYKRQDLVLVCWCKPLNCHAEFIRSAIIALANKG